MCFQLLFALLVALQVGSKVAAYNVYDNEDGGVLFHPDNNIEMPESCKGKNFCFEKGEKYPDELIDELVTKLPDMELELEEPEARISIGPRYGAPDLECEKKVNNSLIYYITDINNKERVVVQSQAEGHFRQYYNVTWCSKEFPTSSQTRLLQGTKCVTHTMDLDFFVLSENYVFDNHKPKMTVAKARIPVCCRCEFDIEEYNRKFEQIRQNFMTNGN